jgi:hypothetical protein
MAAAMKLAEGAINIHDPYMALLLRQAEDRAELDNSSSVVAIHREGEAWAKRRRYLEQQQAKVEVMTHG